jgi:chromosome partitioning protein
VDSIGEIIQALAEVADVVLCDLQGSAGDAMLHAIHYADLVLIPVQPSNDDLKSCHSTARHVVQAGKSARRTIPYRIVISRVSTGFRPEVERVVEQALEIANRGPGRRSGDQSEGGLCGGARYLGRNCRGGEGDCLK